ncbi:MAG: hypothetical protein DBY25_00490 [Clostridiales bacterium]|nr:MAG: hypothetical protein DBY25_00490 [Clostridiales bacterium]
MPCYGSIPPHAAKPVASRAPCAKPQMALMLQCGRTCANTSVRSFLFAEPYRAASAKTASGFVR